MHDAEPLGAAGHRDVEVVAAARRCGEDRAGVGDEHRVELQALGLGGSQQDDLAGQVGVVAERHVGYGAGDGFP
jgi:hypothetical protein